MDRYDEAESTALAPGFVSGNYFDKYSSKNPVHAALVARFVDCAREMIRAAAPRTILEVGCGPGDLALRLLGPDDAGGPAAAEYVGTDISEREVTTARARYPGRSFLTASVYDLPFKDSAFDLVVACEVFEHLERPRQALDEVRRVCGSHLLISVPWEPVWRLCNLLRMRYVHSLGNTPGHVQHFSRRGLRRLVGGRFDVVAERRPFPWTMILARRDPGGARGDPAAPRAGEHASRRGC